MVVTCTACMVADEVRDRIIAEIHRTGVAVAQIARRAGLSRPTIHTVID